MLSAYDLKMILLYSGIIALLILLVSAGFKIIRKFLQLWLICLVIVAVVFIFLRTGLI